ncbi:hypothetical protein CIHG_00680 [Coccidioides immitis H538.4]|uniref:Uncharacterized protein n=3 Tax=Coccidioides immitis TaxID=5501 RepID=A0A0J8QRS3_COCIT|nr:hypothetical protein CIRG_03099 [Coccidioides immitis RMSCC 2394]KMU73948.1 hypothetical protein CISG_03926 [Coccidioides immitis RMSCC 3703]KMU82897.1 hypothetical protein CIHG_00680 [Coccidioides immitis H538.4]
MLVSTSASPYSTGFGGNQPRKRLARREALNVLGKISDHRSTGRDSAQSARHRSPSGPGPLQP